MSGKALMQQQGFLGTNEAFSPCFHVLPFNVCASHRPSFVLVLIGSPSILLLSCKLWVELGFN